MKQYTKWIVSFTVLMLVLCVPSLVQAQACDPADTTCVPIDGGLSLLLAAGVGYGVKKIRDSRKKKQAEENI